MARIMVLPESIASRIAAGEVVERPASALKEMIENAIDAGARAIEIRLEAGGRDLMVVLDDGEGMGPDDILLALERHATSKIQSDMDIEQVRTLGFRGEAVPAIASVSRFTLSSRDASSEAATVVEVHAGKLISVRQEPAPRGTRVEVRALFYNAPARRKFLRSADTERQKAGEVVSRFAMGYPEIRFRLVADGRLVFDHAPMQNALERCAQVLGRQMTTKLLPLDVTLGTLRVLGLCSGLSETRSHARDQHLYVNRRPVRDRLLAHAVSFAYSEVLPRGRHPVMVLMITVPPEMVDVNVHPTKSEVRFRRPGEVHDSLARALQQCLREAGAAPRLEVRTPERDGEALGGFPGRSARDASTAGSSEDAAPWEYRPGSSGAEREPGAGDERSLRTGPGPSGRIESLSLIGRVSEGEMEGTGGFAYAPPRFPVPRQGADPEAGLAGSAVWGDSTIAREAGRKGTPDEPSVAPLGQFLESYILASDRGTLLIVDQHAAHERVLFERLLLREAAGTQGGPEGQRESGTTPPAQRLLMPVPIELAAGERLLADAVLEALRDVGFEVDGFGDGALLLRSVPAELEGADPERLLREVLSDLRDDRPVVARTDLRRRIAASTACHAAIKVHFPLTAAKMAWLLGKLFRCETPTTCPHGRPIILRIGLEEIERGFHRR